MILPCVVLTKNLYQTNKKVKNTNSIQHVKQSALHLEALINVFLFPSHGVVLTDHPEYQRFALPTVAYTSVCVEYW